MLYKVNSINAGIQILCVFEYNFEGEIFQILVFQNKGFLMLKHRSWVFREYLGKDTLLGQEDTVSVWEVRGDLRDGLLCKTLGHFP